MGAVCFSSFITPKLTKQYNKSRYVLHELVLEWMSEWSYSLLLVLWWLPHHLEDKVLSSCTSQHSLPLSDLLTLQWNLPCLRNRGFMLQQRWADWQSQNTLVSVSDLVHAIRGCLEAPFLLMLGWWDLWLLWKCPDMEMSLLPQYFSDSLCSLSLGPFTPWREPNHLAEKLWTAGPRALQQT